MITANEYQKLCLKTAPQVSTACPENLLLQGVMGMCGEAGEAIDIVKKITFQGHKLDEEAKHHLALECGDVLWYVSTTAYALGYDLTKIMQMNVEKLAARYPEGFFTSERSLHRAEGDI